MRYNNKKGQDIDAVAEAMEKIHAEAASVLQYRDENSLSCAITEW